MSIAQMTNRALVKLRVERIGYFVPAPSFDGVVQSVYARACNVAWGTSLLTLVAPGLGDGPTSLVLGGDRAIDLTTCFCVGDAVLRRGERLESPGTDIDLARAILWRPDDRPEIAHRSQVEANLREAGARLEVSLDRHASIVHREGRVVCSRLEDACRAYDLENARVEALWLIGWGEGLTPAGDDFLVGLLAALEAATPSSIRATFLAGLSAAVLARVHLTTPIAAHFLQLAASGHFTADLHRLRNALLCSDDIALLRRLVDDALAVGATSGADRVAGLLAGISAWLPPHSAR
jgi:hypothetical protein